jgi:hypothetical protein
VTTVRMVYAQHIRAARAPDGSDVPDFRLHQQLIVLADDAGHRAVPLWLRIHKDLRARVAQVARVHGLDRPAGDAEVASGLLETAVRVLRTAGTEVSAVDIEPASDDVPELRWDTVTARVGLATATGTRPVTVSAEYGLALAAVAGAPVRVPDAVMDRLAVPVPGEDMRAPFLPPAEARPWVRPWRSRRSEPRNMAFTDGLDYWELAAGSSSPGGQPAWQDYSCTAADQSAVLAAALPEPAGFAVLVQEIAAAGYRGRTVTFRGQLRTADITGQAGLHLAVSVPPAGLSGAQLRDHGGSSLAAPGSSGWTWHQVTVPVPGEATVILFGISLAGRGRIELRGAELTPAPPGTPE